MTPRTNQATRTRAHITCWPCAFSCHLFRGIVALCHITCRIVVLCLFISPSHVTFFHASHITFFTHHDLVASWSCVLHITFFSHRDLVSYCFFACCIADLCLVISSFLTWFYRIVTLCYIACCIVALYMCLVRSPFLPHRFLDTCVILLVVSWPRPLSYRVISLVASCHFALSDHLL